MSDLQHRKGRYLGRYTGRELSGLDGRTNVCSDEWCHHNPRIVLTAEGETCYLINAQETGAFVYIYVSTTAQQPSFGHL